MSTEPPREHPSTYVVEDRSNQKEMERLEIQDKMLTAGMGGVLGEVTNPGSLRRVLDVGCGTGDWLIETAQTYPTIEKLIGADISAKILDYARTKAETLQLGKRVQFKTMDALRVLEFPDLFFDLVNQRLGFSWLRTWEWRKLLTEYQRVTRPGGIVRITESNACLESNSSALLKLSSIVLETFFNSGRLFTKSNEGITGELVRLMTQYGFEDVQSRVHTLVYRAGTLECQYFYQDVLYFYRVGLPFFQKWTRVPSDYEETYQQALKEMQQPDFVATGTLRTAWGTTPTSAEDFLIRGLQ